MYGDGEWTKEEEGDDPNKVFVVSFSPGPELVEPLEWKALENRLKPSSVDMPKLKLKELPEHPKLAFLQENNQLPVVILSALSFVEKTRLLEVLWNHKGAIAWSIADIKGIDSSFYTHKNLKEESLNLVVQLKASYPTSRKEFDIEIRDKKGAENLATDHLSRLENPDLRKLTRTQIRDLFPEERLMAISDKNNEPCGPSRGHHGIATTARKVFEAGLATFAIDYVSKWVEAYAFPTSDARNVVNFLRRLFARFGIPKALISDRDTHFCNYQMEKAMKRYGVVHRFSTTYHPQTNGQVENTNRAIKRILKKTIGNNRKDWSYKLDDALWAFRTTFKTPLGTTSFRIIYGKACHLPVELEHKVYWAIKNYNMDLMKAGENRFLQINELDEMRLDAYESFISYKERTKRWHDKRIKLPINYEKGDKLLLFNSRLRLFLEKLKSRWYGPFPVSKDMKNGAIELYDE
ncbi:reverse transcriptase domain-containing protein, partial [Tanacetum coccineum]